MHLCPFKADPLTSEEVDTLYETRQLRKHNPSSLINTLRYNNTLYFGTSGGATEHHNMRWGDVVLKHDAELGLEYLEHHELITKTRTGDNITDTRTCPPRMYATPNEVERCHVATYILYRAKRPDGYCNPDD